VTAIPNDKIYFLPDRLMGKNLVNELKKRGVQKTVLYSNGSCYVHEEYSTEMIDYIRLQYPGVQVSAHPECSEEIVKRADYTGSTSQIINFVKNSPSSHHFMLTECGLTSRLQSEDPSKTFVGTCTMCKYMKSNSLDNILTVLEKPTEQHIITLNPDKTEKALKCIDAMFDYTTNLPK
jgi:quinolinate synthase